MKDFRDFLIVKENKESISVNFFFRTFKCIEINEYELSIQASILHHCTPKENLSNYYKYQSMEVAIFKNKSWCNITEDSFFSNWSRYTEFCNYYDGMVGSNIAIDLIQSLFEYIILNVKNPPSKFFDTNICNLDEVWRSL